MESGTKQHRIRHYVHSGGELIPRESGMRGEWPCDAKCSCGWETRSGGAVRSFIEKAVRDHKFDVKHGLTHEALALAAEARIQGATTQAERERWQRTANAHWGLA